MSSAAEERKNIKTLDLNLYLQYIARALRGNKAYAHISARLSEAKTFNFKNEHLTGNSKIGDKKSTRNPGRILRKSTSKN